MLMTYQWYKMKWIFYHQILKATKDTWILRIIHGYSHHLLTVNMVNHHFGSF
jgi:hypothetical protein